MTQHDELELTDPDQNLFSRGAPEQEPGEEDERSSLEIVRDNLSVVVTDVEFFINEDEEFGHYEQDDRMDMIDAYAHLLKARDLL